MNLDPLTNIAPENGYFGHYFHFGSKRPIFRGELLVASSVDAQKLCLSNQQA